MAKDSLLEAKVARVEHKQQRNGDWLNFRVVKTIQIAQTNVKMTTESTTSGFGSRQCCKLKRLNNNNE